MSKITFIVFLLTLIISSLVYDQNNIEKSKRSFIADKNDHTKGIKSNNIYYNTSIQYIVITPENLAASITPLVSWKNTKGIRTEITSMEDITDNYSGIDSQEKVKNYLKDLKSENDLLKWVLFVGNETINPVRYAFVDDGYYPDGDLVVTDHYFSDLQNNWDNDNDTVYAEENFDNWYFDLTVGRIPFTSVENIAKYVQRIISYEQNPPSIEEYYNNAIFAAPIMNYPQESYPLTDNAQLMEYIKENYFSENYNISTLYEKSGIMPSEYETTILLNRTNMVNILNEENQSSLLFLSGHGSKNSLWRQEWYNDINEDGYASEDELRYYPYISTITPINTTINNQTPFFIYLDACDVGWFDDDEETLAEYLLTENGLGVVAASRTTWYSTIWNGGNDYNQGLATRFWEQFGQSEDNRPAEILVKAKEDYLTTHSSIDERERKNILSYNYLGDPELSLYTENPKELLINHSYNDNSQIMEIRVLDKNNYNNSIENAQINIKIKLNDDYNTFYSFIETTDNNGLVSIAVNNTLIKKIDITVIKENYIPELIEIIDLKPPEITMNNIIPYSITNNPNITINWLYVNNDNNETIYCDLFIDEYDKWFYLGENITTYSLVLSNGNHSLVLKIYDSFNNYFTKDLIVIIDQETPLLDIDIENTQFYQGEEISLGIYAYDEITCIERIFISIDNDYDDTGTLISEKSTIFNYKLPNLQIGDHKVNITVLDSANNSKMIILLIKILNNPIQISSNTSVIVVNTDSSSSSNNVGKKTSMSLNVIFNIIILIAIKKGVKKK